MQSVYKVRDINWGVRKLQIAGKNNIVISNKLCLPAIMIT